MNVFHLKCKEVKRNDDHFMEVYTFFIFVIPGSHCFLRISKHYQINLQDFKFAMADNPSEQTSFSCFLWHLKKVLLHNLSYQKVHLDELPYSNKFQDESKFKIQQDLVRHFSEADLYKFTKMFLNPLNVNDNICVTHLFLRVIPQVLSLLFSAEAMSIVEKTINLLKISKCIHSLRKR